MAIKTISFGTPSKIVKSAKELQATIPQHTEINTSTLIAISTDNGNNWTFLDTLNRDITTIRKLLPNLNPSITIPPQRPPLRYN